MNSQTIRLLVTRALTDKAMAFAGERFHIWCNPHDRIMTTPELLAAAQAHGADALLVTAFDRLDKAAIEALPPAVKVVATYSVGHNHIDLAAASARGLAVLSTPDVLSDTVAEMALLLMLAAARRAYEGQRLIYDGRWVGWTPTLLLGRDVVGARLGVFGMGRIGRSVARRAARGFDMAVHYHNRSRLPGELEQGAVYHADAADLLAVSDFLVLTAPSTPQTARFLDAARIARLPRGAIVVNVARGDLVDDAALIAALREGQVAAAGLDVFDNEPDIHPGYLDLPNVFLQPHQGSSTLGARVRMAELLTTSIASVLAGAPVANRIV
ncbi:MAG: D-glycerate dehydrogenase [Methylobacteriaceae bacterium]|nr:D-glycerate dehydrogenase [Methylobacteriaceae bacterium]